MKRSSSIRNVSSAPKFWNSTNVFSLIWLKFNLLRLDKKDESLPLHWSHILSWESHVLLNRAQSFAWCLLRSSSNHSCPKSCGVLILKPSKNESVFVTMVINQNTSWWIFMWCIWNFFLPPIVFSTFDRKAVKKQKEKMHAVFNARACHFVDRSAVASIPNEIF